MSDTPADSRALAAQTQGESWLAGPKPSGEGWSQRRFLFFIAFAFALHAALVVIFGTKKPVVPRAVTNVPHLQLADSANELIALGDPTLFARPNAHDFVSALWQRPQVVSQHQYHWSEDPRYLLPEPEKFGAAFGEFMKTNPPPELPLSFKSEPARIEPAVAFDATLPRATTMRLSGELAQRRLLKPVELPAIAVNDVIPPSRVQVLVDTAGNVASAVLLPAEDGFEAAAHYDPADQRALQLVRNLRFMPAPRLMFGKITFNWHTVPMTATNAP